jgi:curli biogenesis system outer membrane secretion channel CsgG
VKEALQAFFSIIIRSQIRKLAAENSPVLRLQSGRIWLLLWLVFLFVLGCAAPQQSLVDSLPTYHGTRKIFAVLEFQNATDYGGDQLSRVASDMLITAMKRSGRFLLVERERLDRVLEERALGQTGTLDPNTRAKVGQVLGAQYIILGTVTGFDFKEKDGSAADAVLESTAASSPGEARCKKMDTRAVIDVRAVEVKSGRILWSERAEGGDTGLTIYFRFGTDQVGGGFLYDETVATKTLRRAIDQCVYDVSLAMKERPWEGRIAKIDSGKVFVVGGRDVGVPVNSEVEIFKVEAGPADPISGEILEITEQVMGKGIIVRVEEHYSVVQVREGGGFSFNDLVRLANR